MVIAATVLIYHSYLRLNEPQTIILPEVAIIALLISGLVSLYLSLKMAKVSQKSKILSLRASAYNIVKDTSATFLVLVAVLASALGLSYMDAVGGIIIGGYIYSVAYVSIKEASLILMDVWRRPELSEEIKHLLESGHQVEVIDIKLRGAGASIMGIIDIAADGNLTLYQVDEIKKRIVKELKEHIEGLWSITVDVHPKT